MEYSVITMDDMSCTLRSEKGWVGVDLPHVWEHVLDWPITHQEKTTGSVIRVYTSIVKATGVSRPCGTDAIRICAVNTVRDKGLVKSVRVLRVKGWRKNLQSAVLGVLKIARARLQQGMDLASTLCVLQPVDIKHVSFPELKYKKDRLQWLREKLADNSWALWGLSIISKFQTFDEYDAGVTVVSNHVGFTGIDAEILTSFNKQFTGGKQLSQNQLPILRHKMPKYAGQLAEYLKSEGLFNGVRTEVCYG